MPAPQPVMPLPVNPPPAAVAPAKPRINVRNKGQRGEREVVKLLQDICNAVCVRLGALPPVLQRNALQAHLGGEDIHGLEGFAVEVKFQENENVPAWWRQTLEQAERQGEGTTPVLFYRCSHAKWTVKFRGYVETPAGISSIEMDLETTVDDFAIWFAEAYAEKVQAMLGDRPLPLPRPDCV